MINIKTKNPFIPVNVANSYYFPELCIINTREAIVNANMNKDDNSSGINVLNVI